ncbi:hypothetical protein Glove_428g125 [Diversispora epigaea]|uniref:Treble clef zinc finger domain-containing protein n=1 Tax=Diversispora epigaea TaxID=1348612 RepID=A0A397GTC6_9GLOM|nr:hypothetical protein Glove_428g125 [Diversispora epigaea]
MKKISLNTACEIAIKRGGLCLSTEYINGKSHLRWKCVKGHEWEATLSNIKYQNTWCPYCAGQAKNTLDIAKMIAINKGGECISNEYINGSSHLRWKCAKGHEWSATLQNVKNKGSWCAMCVGQNRTIEYIQHLARKQNGNCLSNSYKDAHSKLIWNCSKGHVWKATFASIKYHGSWCPYCSNKYLRENLCREIITNILDHHHLKIADPIFLNPSNTRGQQHEKYTKFFHRGDPDNFIKQQERDQLKKELCEENWIVLRYV